MYTTKATIKPIIHITKLFDNNQLSLYLIDFVVLLTKLFLTNCSTKNFLSI